jgi:hypothetical protein
VRVAKARQKGLVDHNDPADFSLLTAKQRCRHPEVLALLGEPRRMGHKRKRRSFETPRKRAAPQDDG